MLHAEIDHPKPVDATIDRHLPQVFPPNSAGPLACLCEGIVRRQVRSGGRAKLLCGSRLDLGDAMRIYISVQSSERQDCGATDQGQRALLLESTSRQSDDLWQLWRTMSSVLGLELHSCTGCRRDLGDSPLMPSTALHHPVSCNPQHVKSGGCAKCV
jgi:hypothetical protein